jgi:tRNA G18 (ribose-2'-O)-methylase SpoU
MAAIPICNVDDPRVDVYRDLKDSSPRRPAGLFVVESLLVTRRLLASGIRVHSVLTEERYVRTLEPQLPDGVPLYVVPRTLVAQIAGYRFHRGVLACGYRPGNASLDPWLSPRGSGTWTVCIGVQDPENLGGILRSSAAFGVRGVLLGPDCADPFSRRVARTSMAANFQVPIRVPVDLQRELAEMRARAGVRLIATILDPEAQPLHAARRFARQAVVLGGEGFGLDNSWVELCDHRVTMLMQPGIDSLNVSVAAGILLYYFTQGEAHRGGP